MEIRHLIWLLCTINLSFPTEGSQWIRISPIDSPIKDQNNPPNVQETKSDIEVNEYDNVTAFKNDNEFTAPSFLSNLLTASEHLKDLGNQRVTNKRAILVELHDSLMNQISDEIDSQWSTKKKRSLEEGREHSSFPSSESTLMTIGFLTFAVYLIKLVLQVMTALKAKKSMMITPMVTAAGRASIENENFKMNENSINKILMLMNTFNEK